MRPLSIRLAFSSAELLKTTPSGEPDIGPLRSKVAIVITTSSTSKPKCFKPFCKRAFTLFATDIRKYSNASLSSGSPGCRSLIKIGIDLRNFWRLPAAAPYGPTEALRPRVAIVEYAVYPRGVTAVTPQILKERIDRSDLGLETFMTNAKLA